MEEKQQDNAIINQGKALIAASDPLEDYKMAVWAAYGNSIDNKQSLMLATIAHRYGLNPNPGLDLIYGWIQDGKFKVQISYKGWLALGHRFKKFVYKFRTLDQEEVIKRGNGANEIVVICEAIDFEVAERVGKLKSWGFDVDPNDYRFFGIGVVTRAEKPPKGRDLEWLAKKRATKDAMVQMLANAFNINMPTVQDGQYDRETDQWVMEAPQPSNRTVEMVLDGSWQSAEAIENPVVNEESDLAEPAETPDHVTEVKTETVEAGEAVTPAPVETPAPPVRTAQAVFDQLKAKAEKLATGETKEPDRDDIAKLIIHINAGDGQYVRHYVLEQAFGVKSTNDLKAHEFWALDAWARGKTFKGDVDIIQQHISENPKSATETQGFPMLPDSSLEAFGRLTPASEPAAEAK